MTIKNIASKVMSMVSPAVSDDETSEAPIETYTQLSDIDHVLCRKDMYFGKSNIEEASMFTYDVDKNKVIYEKVTYHSGILKLFDEVFTNAVDNYERKRPIKNINVIVKDDSITVYNDGATIPIKKASPPNDDIYIPELVFTRMRAGSNFNDNVKRTYGGRNGVGCKLAAIFSTEFIIRVCDNNKLYTQVVTGNDKCINKPTIQKFNHCDFVQITFKPDFSRLNCKRIDNMTKKVIYKRVHDASYLPICFSINGKPLPKCNWDQFCCSYPSMYNKDMRTPIVTYEDPISRWRVGLAVADKGTHTSFVNYVNTEEGGKHVDCIISQITDYINTNVVSEATKAAKAIKGKGKAKAKTVKPTTTKATTSKPKAAYTTTQVKSHMMLYLSAIVVNPEFDSQSKVKLSSNVTFKLPVDVIERFISNTNIIAELDSKLQSKLLGTRKNILDVEKYIKANKANAHEGYKCTLFICEGLSAKTMCVTGMNIIGYDYFGVYPLRGKMLNTRDASMESYMNNREIQDLRTIIGISEDKTYETTKGLNYGRIVCMKDADSDGADIMGLVMNFFQTKFPSLVAIPGFFNEFITPMIQIVVTKPNNKALPKSIPTDINKRYQYTSFKRNDHIDFYNEVEYNKFINYYRDALGTYNVRYIKGLASNTKDNINEYFNHFNKYLINVCFDGNTAESLDLAFNKKRSDDRKKWMATLTTDTHLPRVSGQPIHIDDFINKELITFSLDACKRTIPSAIDGLKPVQRKVLYTMFNEKSIKGEIKVFQLTGNVGRFANYHHGDASLNDAIIKMAQAFPGSNNIPLLKNASDGFGTRQENGNDCGQPRYLTINARNDIIRMIYPAIDDNILKRRVEDDEIVEPIYYVPIIPMIVVNGCNGIGMGWSTTIPSHSTKDVIEYVKYMLNLSIDDKNDAVRPRIRHFYNDYDGIIEEIKDGYKHTGKFTISGGGCNVHVTEIPIKYSIANFRDITVNTLSLPSEVSKKLKSEDSIKEAQENLVNKSGYQIIDVKNNAARNINHIDMELTFDKPIDKATVISLLKLTCNIKTTNMTLFDEHEQIKRYNDIYDIISHWYNVRHSVYAERINYLINNVTTEIMSLSNKARFVKANIEETLDYKNRSDKETYDILQREHYDLMNDSYDYLLSMQIRSFTKDKYEKLLKELERAKARLEELKHTTVERMWLDELEDLEYELDNEGLLL